MFPFVVVNENNMENPPVPANFVIDYNGNQVITYNNDLVTAEV